MTGRTRFASFTALAVVAAGGIATESALLPAASFRASATTATSTATTATGGSSSSASSSAASGNGCASASASASASAGGSSSSSSSSSSSGACPSTTATSTTTTAASALLIVVKKGASAAGGTVTSSPAGIACGTTCSAAFQPGTLVTLTESTITGVVFHGWGGACAPFGTSSTCTLVLGSGTTVVTARFEPVGTPFRPAAVLSVQRRGPARVQAAGRGWIVLFRFRISGPATATPCELHARSCTRSFPSAFLTGGPTHLGVFAPLASGRGLHVYAIVFRNGRDTLRLTWPATRLR